MSEGFPTPYPTERQLIEAWVRDIWGERCSDFDPNCVTCALWAAFDDPANRIPASHGAAGAAPTPAPSSKWAWIVGSGDACEVHSAGGRSSWGVFDEHFAKVLRIAMNDSYAAGLAASHQSPGEPAGDEIAPQQGDGRTPIYARRGSKSTLYGYVKDSK